MNSSDSNILLITNYLKETYKPVRIFLYGSRANNTYTAESDYDFVMVLAEFDKSQRLSLMSSLSSYFLNILGISVQIWTYSEKDFLDWKDEFSSIPETALNTGKEIELG